MQNDISHQKAAARLQATANRNAAFLTAQRGPDADLAAHSLLDLLAGQFGAGLSDVVLAGYMPMRSEIDPLPAMVQHRGPVCVPVITGAGQPLEFHRWTPDTPMREGPFKALIPVAHDPITPQALIVPLLAFDLHGYRLGYGGGFYDRSLEKLRKHGPVLAVGLAFDAQLCDRVPVNDTDQQLDAVVTARGVVWSRLG
ncbi:5-formyltetrahydrofolate cyclo-ligase [Roseinatronobacter sp. NSM]|uniref:5-formyltetrahydrofolate cyclo-ligase n=1 Tax=Roseinatronobacter sp. NSM TaxID=3457785 RepID=UPI004035AE45